jgi:hypothetical protein
MMAPATSLPSVPTSVGARREDAHPHGHRGPRRRWLDRPLSLVLSIAVTAAGLGACGAGRNVLGTNTSPCFLALPVAKRAVEGHGSLAGVRLVDTARLRDPGGRAMRALLDLLPGPVPQEVCVVAFTGSYTLSQVELPAGFPPAGEVGRYAIVVVTIPRSMLLGTFVVRHAPLVFIHAHVGF